MSVVEIDERGRMTVPKKVRSQKIESDSYTRWLFLCYHTSPEDPAKESRKMVVHK